MYQVTEVKGSQNPHHLSHREEEEKQLPCYFAIATWISNLCHSCSTSLDTFSLTLSTRLTLREGQLMTFGNKESKLCFLRFFSHTLAFS